MCRSRADSPRGVPATLEYLMFELFDPEGDVRITKGTNLPHWFQPGVTYFITFRTEDSIPANVSRRWYAERARWLGQHGIAASEGDWQDQLASLPKDLRRTFHETFSRQYMENLDKGWGACVLRQSALSRIVADSFLHFDGDRYHMGDFVVMPNHVHVLVCMLGDTEVEAQCYSWKKFTAGKINKAIRASGRFWQEESFDHLIRSPEQFDAIRCYIANNPSRLKEGEYYLYRLK